MNVTPMIDILLVLLIIFMVIVPVVPKGLAALVPQPPKMLAPDPVRAIVVQVFDQAGAAPTYRINDVDATYAELLPKLTEIYANRAERVMFVKGGDHVDFAYIADVIDIGRAANVDHIGLLTPMIQAGQ
ncbi:MAG: biopolymer transporter ExbD [Terracidiphilus sp.]